MGCRVGVAASLQLVRFHYARQHSRAEELKPCEDCLNCLEFALICRIMQDEAQLQSLKAGSRESPFSKGCVPRIGHGLMFLQYHLTGCVKSRKQQLD
jgi:hypothetical protein